MQPRILPLQPPYSQEVETVLRKLMPPNSPVEPLALFRTMAHNSAISSRLVPLGSGFLAHPSIDPRDRELVIHRVTARCGAEYEWGVHVAFFGGALGIPEKTLNATVTASADDPIWTPREALLIRLVDELHNTAAISDHLWAALAQQWNESQLIELLLLVGFYHAISYVCNAARVPLESYAARFPE